YAIESVVAEGGFSTIYRARHTLWNRPVAIKAFHGADGLDAESRDEMIRTFIQEGAMLAELSERTTAVVQAREIATTVTPAGDWVPFLVLEWLDGQCLDDVLWRERQALLPPRTLAEAFALLDPVGRALALAHDKGICHRDVKPGNIFVLGEPRGRDCATKLLDFGVASFFSRSEDEWPPAVSRAAKRVTDSYAFTPAYAAPEQFSTAYGETGPWTDVFSLALILTELVVGHGPIAEAAADRSVAPAARAARRPTPAALGVRLSPRAERVFERALASSPSDRWPTAGAFWQALGRVAEVRNVHLRARPTVAGFVAVSGVTPPRRRALRKTRSRAAVVALGALAIALGASASTHASVVCATPRARSLPKAVAPPSARPLPREHASTVAQ
ncbi:MAG: serine/threonine protein kinase, partial [Polyangiaceae bacterium]|nr:serine/threonine protein kinase [Polyangiaceae bacterium]